MPIAAKDLVEHANLLLSNSSCEVEYRNVVSKSYYAMYHSVLSILNNKPPRYDKQGVHASLISYLQSHDIKSLEQYEPTKLKALSFMLSQYKDKRVAADYCLDLTVTKDQALEIATAAIRFKDKCDSLQTSNNK
ncbi:hypothetical protein [Vibrio tritonius]|uniref:hypothetical protein n=1 Tax=Vibrio tritonius TaxID=1435069 RepID=UPI00315CB4C5